MASDGTTAGIQLIGHAYASGSGAQVSFPVTFAFWNQNQFSADQITSAKISAIAPAQSVVSITAATAGSGIITYTYTLTNGTALVVPEEIIVTGMTNANNNGTFLIQSLGSGTFTVPVTTAGTTESGSTGTGTSPTDAICGIVNRATIDAQNAYYVLIGNNSSYVAFGDGAVHDNRQYCHELWKNNGGTGTFIGGQTPTAFDAVNDIWQLLTAGKKLAMIRNGVMFISVDDTSVVSGSYAGITVASATGAGNTVPLGANNGVSGTQWTNWTARDLGTLNISGWTKRAEESFNVAGPLANPPWSTHPAWANSVTTQSSTLGPAGIAVGSTAGTNSALYTNRVWANPSARPCTPICGRRSRADAF